jgi:SAM-dependent methyltransferase
MTRDIARENIDRYVGEKARKDWSVDGDLYPVELDVIARHFPQAPARVLDMGCGAGRTTIGLEARGYDVEALDLSPDLVDEARKRVQRTQVHVMDARELAFADASFDVVMFSFNGLDCVYPSRERHRVLVEVHRVLRPGGLFYYSGHNIVAAWTPRPGDSFGSLMRRNKAMLAAQRQSFGERDRYLAYPETTGTQVLYSALPHVHLRELRATGFTPQAVYGSRSYRRGPHFLDGGTVDQSVAFYAHLGKLSLACPHVHYVAQKS